jgi:hypothetical protein
VPTPFRKAFSYTFIIQATAQGPHDAREQHVLEEVALAESAPDRRRAAWRTDPFAPGLFLPIMYNQMDDERWDPLFPEHPLTRLRTHLRRLCQTCRVSQEVRQSDAFTGSEPPVDIEEVRRGFMSLIDVPVQEQQSCEETARHLILQRYV